MSLPKKIRKCQAPLLKITGVISGTVTPKDKTKAVPSPLAEKKAIKMRNNLIELGL